MRLQHYLSNFKLDYVEPETEIYEIYCIAFVYKGCYTVIIKESYQICLAQPTLSKTILVMQFCKYSLFYII